MTDGPLRRRFRPIDVVMYRYDGTNHVDVTRHLGTDGWSTMPDRYPRVGDWVYHAPGSAHFGFMGPDFMEFYTEEMTVDDDGEEDDGRTDGRNDA